MKLLEQIRAAMKAKLDERAAAEAEVDALVSAVEERGDANLTEDESARLAEFRSTIKNLDDEIAKYEARIAELEADAEKRAKAEKLAGEIPAQGEQRNRPVIPGPVKVNSEERTYGKASEQRGISFLRDVMNAQTRGDFAAGQRLARHMEEELVERADYKGMLTEARDVATSAWAGLTVPQYLTDLVAPDTKNLRPFADICRKHPLPADGMTVNISRVTTASSAAIQATENAAVSETDMDDTLLTVNVRTIAGQQDVSRQVIDRSTGADSVTIADLIGEYHTTLDSGIINDDGTSGTHLGISNVSGNVGVTYTDASPTAAELYPKLADLIQQIQAATNMGLTHFVMHPRRWWWIASQLSSTFPLVQITGDRQAGTLGDTSYAAVGANIMGVPVVLDRNVATTLGGGTEDAIYGVDATECHLWEDPNAPLFIRAEQTAAGNLTVKFVVYGYSAFTAGRYPLATGDITGTGLAAPTF